jgi:nucleotide-binding universal stress UspA family protein
VKVIIATDGTEGALEAAREAVELLRPGSTVSLVAVVPARVDPMEDAGGFEGPILSEEEADEQWKEGVAAGEAALSETAKAIGPDVETFLVPSTEPPGKALVRLAEEQKPDVLIIGSERPGFFQRLFGHSVTDEVVHHAPCPVLVVPHLH